MDNELNELSQLQNAVANDDALIAYFYSDNCAPCLSLRPKIKDMIARKYPKMKLYFINSEKYPNMTSAYSIFSNPTLLTYFDRKEYLRKSKFVSIPEMEEGIDRLYNMMFS